MECNKNLLYARVLKDLEHASRCKAANGKIKSLLLSRINLIGSIILNIFQNLRNIIGGEQTI
jgi:hypothetical protein